MVDVAVGSVIALWVVAIVETIRLARGTGSRSLTVAVVALVVGRTIDLEPISAALGDTTGVSVLEHAAILVSAAGVVTFTRSIGAVGERRTTPLLRIATDPRTWIILTMALAAPLVQFGERLPASAEARTAVYAGGPLWWLHWASFLGCLVLVLWHGAGLALRNSRTATGVLRVRLLGLGIGQTIGVCYAVLKAAHLVALAVTPRAADGGLAEAEQWALTACIAVVAVGLLIGFVSSTAETAMIRARVWSLWPLWVGLWDHAQHMPAKTPPSRWATALSGDVRMILVRQVVELSDAARAIAPYMPMHDPDDSAAAARAMSVGAARRTAGAPPARIVDVVAGEGESVTERVARLVPIARRWKPLPLRSATSDEHARQLSR